MIHLQPDSRGKGKRSVHLSQATMAWLERSILLWPGEGGPLFRAKGGGAWTSARWKHAFRRFMEGQHLHAYSPSSMRLGKARDLLQQGAHVLDVQEAAGWCVTGPVLRILPRSGGVNPKGDQTEDENPSRVPERLRPTPKDMHTGDLFGALAHG